MGSLLTLLSFAWMGRLVAMHMDASTPFGLGASLLTFSIGAATLILQLLILGWRFPRLLRQWPRLLSSGGGVAVSAACLATAAQALGHGQAGQIFGAAALAGATSAVARTAVQAGSGQLATLAVTMLTSSLGTLVWMVWPVLLVRWLEG